MNSLSGLLELAEQNATQNIKESIAQSVMEDKKFKDIITNL